VSDCILQFIYLYYYSYIKTQPTSLCSNTTAMSHLKIMCRPHPSFSLSVCHSVSQTNPFVLFSWNSALTFCTKRVSSKRAFREKPLSASRTLLKAVNEFLPAHSIFPDGFVWIGYRKSSHNAVVYQINHNRSSGSHTVVQGGNETKNIFFF
jgi:hypothetical protein